MNMENLNYEFFDNCSSLSDAARKIFGRDNYRDCEKIKLLAKKYDFDMITMRGIETIDEYGQKCWFLPNDRKTYSYEEAKRAMDEYNQSHKD